MGLGNRKEGPYSIEFLTSLQPLIRTCQVLVEAHNSFKIVYDQAEVCNFPRIFFMIENFDLIFDF